MKIWVNCIVRNEENFIWYALMSVVDHVDKILVWDTGSDDATADIIAEVKKIKGSKIDFKEAGRQDKEGYTKMRQKMLEQSDCDWILILDGDEVWWEKSIREVVNVIEQKSNSSDALISPFYNMVGDVYHYQKEQMGQYEIGGHIGHITIRAINRQIKGLHLQGPYGEEAFVDGQGIPVQKKDPSRLLFLDAPFMHLTHLQRSSKNSHGKFKYDKGIKVSSNFQFPEVFYRQRPDKIPSPFKCRSLVFEALSLARGILKP